MTRRDSRPPLPSGTLELRSPAANSGMTATGRMRTVVTIRDFFALSTCYYGGRVPGNGLERSYPRAKTAQKWSRGCNLNISLLVHRTASYSQLWPYETNSQLFISFEIKTMPLPDKKHKFSRAIFFATFVVVGMVILPMMVGQKITASPLLLLAIAVMPNFISSLISATEESSEHIMFSRAFNIRVIASVACAFLLIAIYRIAYSLGSPS